MSFKVYACPFCQNAVVFDPDAGSGNLICPECEREFVPDQQSFAMSAKKAKPVTTPVQVCYESAPVATIGGDWCFCRNCGQKLSANAYACPKCGEPINLASNRYNDDCLGCGWVIAIWFCALFIPFGWIIVAIVTSILYWSWRKEYPHKASAVNLHGWCSIIVAIILSLCFGWALLAFLGGLLSLAR